MSRAKLLSCLLFTAQSVIATGLVLNGPPFTATNVSMVWNAPTNRWPANLWIYKVVPQEFSPSVVSNLMAIGGFRMKDRTHVEGQPPFKDKRLLYFANKEKGQQLGIFPPYGFLYYRDEKAREIGKHRAPNVPSEAEVLELALKWLDKLGISRADLARKDDSPELYVSRDVRERGWRDKTTGEHIKEVISRGISFVRRIDGVDFTGRGSDAGFFVSFASEGKIADLELVWRKLQKEKFRAVASPTRIMERLKLGQATMVPLTAVDLSGATKLTIDKAFPCYLGTDGEEVQEFVYPFAALECTLEFQGGREARVALKCPILASDE